MWCLFLYTSLYFRFCVQKLWKSSLIISGHSVTACLTALWTWRSFTHVRIEKRRFPSCQRALLPWVGLINAAEGSLLMHRLYWFQQNPSGWRWMVLTYYHSSRMGPYIPVTFPPQTAVASRATRPIARSFISTLLSFFFFTTPFTHMLLSASTLALFWVSALGYFLLSTSHESILLTFDFFFPLPSFATFAYFTC